LTNGSGSERPKTLRIPNSVYKSEKTRLLYGLTIGHNKARPPLMPEKQNKRFLSKWNNAMLGILKRRCYYINIKMSPSPSFRFSLILLLIHVIVGDSAITRARLVANNLVNLRKISRKVMVRDCGWRYSLLKGIRLLLLL
jgi:hypothetical protein